MNREEDGGGERGKPGGSDRRNRNQDRGINDGAQRVVDASGRKVGTYCTGVTTGKRGLCGRLLVAASTSWARRRNAVACQLGDTRMCRRCTRANTVLAVQHTVVYVNGPIDDNFDSGRLGGHLAGVQRLGAGSRD